MFASRYAIAARLIQFYFWWKSTLFRRTIPACKPNVIKKYSCRPALRPRIFLPPDYATDSTIKYPLFFEIHGGGFIIGQTNTDDEYCSLISKRCKTIVVSLDYTPAPPHCFPALSEDCIATIEEVLKDTELSFDPKNVAVGGMSAGGNLALSIAQDFRLQEVFKAMVVWYPIVDWTISTENRVQFRSKTGKMDLLVPLWPIMKSVYIPPEQDLNTPALSPFFAPIQSFPRRSLFVGAEDDILIYDTVKMAERLAGDEKRTLFRDKATLIRGWTTSQTSLYVANGQPHGFNQRPVKGENGIKRQRIVDEVHEIIIKWLCDIYYEEPYIAR